MPIEEPKTTASLGRYTLHGEIASGGMATVFMARASGDAGFSRVVAIKRMLPKLARDPQFVAMFLDEASLASRIHHPNVVPILDVVADGNGFFIVMDYVRGQSLNALIRASVERGGTVPVDIAVGVMIGVLAGLHAAHDARDKDGHLLDIVHRDVSPHNILVGVDGTPRIMDFGIAKASRQLHVTQAGQIKGKLSYMAPEQIRGERIDRGADIFAAAVVLWGAVAGRRLFVGNDMTETVSQVLDAEVPKLSDLRGDVPPALDAALAVALKRDRSLRYATAREFAKSLERAFPRIAGPTVIGEWVEALAGDVIAERDKRASEAEIAIDSSRPVDRSSKSEPTVRVGAASVLSDHTAPPLVAEEPASDVQTIELRPPYQESASASTTDPSLPSAPSAPPVTAVAGPVDEPTTEVDPKQPRPVDPPRPSRAPAVAIGAVLMVATVVLGLRMFGGPRREPEASPPPTLGAVEPTLAPSIDVAHSSVPEIPAPEAPLALDGGVDAAIAQPPIRPTPRASAKPPNKPAATTTTAAPTRNTSSLDTPLLPERP